MQGLIRRNLSPDEAKICKLNLGIILLEEKSKKPILKVSFIASGGSDVTLRTQEANLTLQDTISSVTTIR